MTQREPFQYAVAPGEQVRIEVTPIKLPAAVRSAQNGQTLENVGTDTTPVFTFNVDKPRGGWHFAKIWFHFPPGTENEAMYRVTIGSGDAAGFTESFQDRPITNRGAQNAAADRAMNYEFEVV